MNRDDTIKILGVLKVAYPNFYKDLKREDAEMTIGLWTQMFENDNSAIVTEAVKALICAFKFPPTIADIKEKMRLITQPEELTEMEAWYKVKSSISYYDAFENFNRLPELLQKIIGSANILREWAQMDISELETVVKSNFMRSYTAKVKSKQQYESLPESTKNMIAGLGDKYKMLDAG